MRQAEVAQDLARDGRLFAQVTVRISPGWQRIAAVLSLAGMGSLILLQVVQDIGHIKNTPFFERLSNQAVTSVELLVLWGGVGLLLYAWMRRLQSRTA